MAIPEVKKRCGRSSTHCRCRSGPPTSVSLSV